VRGQFAVFFDGQAAEDGFVAGQHGLEGLAALDPGPDFDAQKVGLHLGREHDRTHLKGRLKARKGPQMAQISQMGRGKFHAKTRIHEGEVEQQRNRRTKGNWPQKNAKDTKKRSRLI
jgi:hypothetical protein